MKLELVSLLTVVLITVTLFEDVIYADTPIHEFNYKRYSYRKKPKNEKKIKLMKQQCENSDTCRDLFGVEMMSCVRQCMSADCYKELYAEDELEEGEIDVRFSSFKGCIMEKGQLV